MKTQINNSSFFHANIVFFAQLISIVLGKETVNLVLLVCCSYDSNYWFLVFLQSKRVDDEHAQVDDPIARSQGLELVIVKRKLLAICKRVQIQFGFAGN